MKFERGDITATPVNTIEKLKKRYNLDKESGGIAEIPDPLTIDNLIVNLGASFTGNATVDGDISSTGDISSDGSVSSTGDIYEGGTKLEDKYLPLPTQYVHSKSWTDWNNAKTRTYTVSGDGFVFVSVSAKDSSDSDTGSVWIDVLQNNNQIGYNYVRLQSAATVPIGANVAVMTAVANGDVIVARVNATKAGTATAWWRALAFGCTLTES